MCKQNFANSLVMTGGGTGGHYFPAIAIAEGARCKWNGQPIMFVGSKRGIESRLLEKSDWQYLLLDIEGFVGRSIIKIIKSSWKLAIACYQLRMIWKSSRPMAVIGTGGYGSAPALLAARSLGIPFFLHESNAKPGLLVKYLAPYASGVWCGMEAVKVHLTGARSILTGTPVRSAFLRNFIPLQLVSLKSKFRLLVLGGSGGASVINRAMLDISSALLGRFPNLWIMQQVGEKEFNNLSLHVTDKRHSIVPFICNMDTEMEAAALVITRSGASTCAELMACGRPSIMIPMPNSAGNHQVTNAQAMVDDGRTVMIRQNDNLNNDLLDKVSAFVMNPVLLFDMNIHAAANKAVTVCLDDVQNVLG